MVMIDGTERSVVNGFVEGRFQVRALYFVVVLR